MRLHSEPWQRHFLPRTRHCVAFDRRDDRFANSSDAIVIGSFRGCRTAASVAPGRGGDDEHIITAHLELTRCARGDSLQQRFCAVALVGDLVPVRPNNEHRCSWRERFERIDPLADSRLEIRVEIPLQAPDQDVERVAALEEAQLVRKVLVLVPPEVVQDERPIDGARTAAVAAVRTPGAR